MHQLKLRPALAARCLEFVIFTAARSGEALSATWSEIDYNSETWTIPARRMKAGAEHVVPFSKPAFELLRHLRPEDPAPDGRIFAVAGAARSNMAMTMLLRRMGRNDITSTAFVRHSVTGRETQLIILGSSSSRRWRTRSRIGRSEHIDAGLLSNRGVS